MIVNGSTVVVLGGYGVFGARIVRSLARHPQLDVVVAGRNGDAARSFAASLAVGAVRALRADCTRADDRAQLLALRPEVIVDTVGPFQARDNALARHCAESGIHYVDIADGREHVVGIRALDGIAHEHHALIISGASTVPAVSTAVVDSLAGDPANVVAIEVGISPGHRGPRGLATAQSILRYCGKPIPCVVGEGQEFGWGGLQRHRYPQPVGSRWLSHVDVPERALWEARYPNLEVATVRAGLEVGFLHLGLSALSRLVRLGLLESLTPCARAFLSVAEACNRLGSDAGAMHVTVTMRQETNELLRRTWTVIATRGDGPQIPATPAALLVKKLLALPGYAPLTVRGALPCVGLVTIDEILRELRELAIRTVVS
jgi:hypothetical protein